MPPAPESDLIESLDEVAGEICQALERCGHSGVASGDADLAGVRVVLLELARAMVCCAHGLPVEPARSGPRMAVAASHPHARACLDAAASPGWCLGLFFPFLADDPGRRARANARFRQWVSQVA